MHVSGLCDEAAEPAGEPAGEPTQMQGKHANSPRKGPGPGIEPATFLLVALHHLKC